MIQTVQIIGKVWRDPELKQLPSTSLLTMNVAVSLWRKQPGGEYGESVQWWVVKVFGKQADSLAQRLRKGSRIFAAGDMEFRTYLKKDGTTGYSLDLNAQHIKALDKDQAMEEPSHGRGNQFIPAGVEEPDFGDLPF